MASSSSSPSSASSFSPASSASSAPQGLLPEHIIVLVHGNNGAPSDFAPMARKLMQKYRPEEMLVIKSKANHTHTNMGVDVGGAKLATEIVETILAFDLDPNVETYKFSIVAHSLGGLYARFAMVQVQSELAMLNMEYVSFVTLCTPHLGSRRPHVQSGALKSLWRFTVHNTLSSKMFGKTGTDLLIENETEDDHTSRPVLEVMSEPESPFFAALQRFRFCTLGAVANGDMVVPFTSSTIRNVNPYPSIPLTKQYSQWGWKIRYSGFENCSHRVRAMLNEHVDFVTDVEHEDAGLDVSTSQRFPSIDEYDSDNRQEVEFKFDMMKNLQSVVAWRRIAILIEPLGMTGKLRLHDWPINKMQGPNCKANEFINLLCDVLGNDHGLDRRETPLTPPQVDAFGDPITHGRPTSMSLASFSHDHKTVESTERHSLGANIASREANPQPRWKLWLRSASNP